MTISELITCGLWCIFAENTSIFNFLWLFNVLMYAKANLDDDDDGFDLSDLCEQTRLKTAVSVWLLQSKFEFRSN